eukprot:snap_masked-scaffold_29-processed-gene-3.11-mRNA-1 protein AED:1.00 eAED:1.00 QI:0/0/0/0/1/1/4/0/69
MFSSKHCYGFHTFVRRSSRGFLGRDGLDIGPLFREVLFLLRAINERDDFTYEVGQCHNWDFSQKVILNA